MNDKSILQRIEEIENRLMLLENKDVVYGGYEYKYSRKDQYKRNQQDNIDKLMTIVGVR